MKILDNGTAVVDGDMLSCIVIEKNGLSAIQDGARSHNLTHIKPGDYVVDAGAALGDHTVEYLRATGPTGKVIAFEPNPAYAKCLRHNCPGAEIHEEALSDNTGYKRFNDDTLPNLGASHLDAHGRTTVKCVRLDDLALPRLNLLKLDIEGYELRALLGATDTICRHGPIIQMEWSPPALLRAGCDPQSALDWFRICDYEYRTFMGSIDAGGEIIAFPKRRCME